MEITQLNKTQDIAIPDWILVILPQFMGIHGNQQKIDKISIFQFHHWYSDTEKCVFIPTSSTLKLQAEIYS